MPIFEFKVTKNTSANFRKLPHDFQKYAVADGLANVLKLLQDRIKRDTQDWKHKAKRSINHIMVSPTEGKVFGTAEHLNPLVHGRKSSRMPISALQTWAKSKGFSDPIRAGYAIWMWRNKGSSGSANASARLTPPGAAGWGGASSPKVPSDAWVKASSEMKRTIISQLGKSILAYLNITRSSGA